MTVAERKKKKPPTFPYLPKGRARQLKKYWVEDHKIRSKWKAQKRREGLTNQTSAPVEDTSDRAHDGTNVDSEPDTLLDRPEKSTVSSHDKQSLRDLRRVVHASRPPTQKAGSLHHERIPRDSRSRGGKVTVGQNTGQPNMKLRMNVLLEKIKRDLS